MDGHDHLVDALFRKLIQNAGRRFMIGLSRLDGFSHYIWNFRFKFLFEPVERRSYPAVPDWIAAGQAVNGIAFDIVHQSSEEPPIRIG